MLPPDESGIRRGRGSASSSDNDGAEAAKRREAMGRNHVPLPDFEQVSRTGKKGSGGKKDEMEYQFEAHMGLLSYQPVAQVGGGVVVLGEGRRSHKGARGEGVRE